MSTRTSAVADRSHWRSPRSSGSYWRVRRTGHQQSGHLEFPPQYRDGRRRWNVPIRELHRIATDYAEDCSPKYQRQYFTWHPPHSRRRRRRHHHLVGADFRPRGLQILGGVVALTNAANTFEGGLLLNGGITIAPSDAALGTGQVRFQGATLRTDYGGTFDRGLVVLTTGAFDTGSNLVSINGTITGREFSRSSDQDRGRDAHSQRDQSLSGINDCEWGKSHHRGRWVIRFGRVEDQCECRRHTGRKWNCEWGRHGECGRHHSWRASGSRVTSR